MICHRSTAIWSEWRISTRSGNSTKTEGVQIDPQRLLRSLRWKHNARPPDVELVLVRERNPSAWFPYAAELLLGALGRADPLFI
jgi:hypothetical protein